MAVVHFDGQDYTFDLEEVTLAQARGIKRETGMALGEVLEQAAQLDGEALAAMYWLMLTQNGTVTEFRRLPSDFKVLKFGRAVNAAMGAEADPTQEAPTEAPVTP